MVWPLQYPRIESGDFDRESMAFDIHREKSKPDIYGMSDADSRGCGPDRWYYKTWSKERGLFSRTRTPANFREKTFLLPTHFTSFATIDWEQHLEIVNIAGMSAPSHYGVEQLQKIYKEKIESNTLRLIALTEHPPEDPSFLKRTLGRVITHIPITDYAGDFHKVETVIKNASEFYSSESGKSIVHYCAWGLGRTGTVLCAYQLVEDFAKACHADAGIDPDFLEYVVRHGNSTTKDISNSDHIVLIAAPPGYDESYNKSPTTPVVASAIYRIRNMTNPPLICVEDRSEVATLEQIEQELCKSVCTYLLKRKIIVKYEDWTYAIKKTPRNPEKSPVTLVGDLAQSFTHEPAPLSEMAQSETHENYLHNRLFNNKLNKSQKILFDRPTIELIDDDETGITSEDNEQFLDRKIIEIIKRDGIKTKSDLALLFGHSYFKNPRVDENYTEIEQLLSKEKMTEILLDHNNYNPHILNHIFERICRFEPEIQYAILSSSKKNGITPLMLAPQISRESVCIIFRSLMMLTEEQRFSLFEQRSKMGSTPLLLAAINYQSGLREMLEEISKYDDEHLQRLLLSENSYNCSVFNIAVNHYDAETIKLLLNLVARFSVATRRELIFNQSIYGDNVLVAAIINKNSPEAFNLLIAFIEKSEIDKKSLAKLLSYKVEVESTISYSNNIIGWNVLMLAIRYHPRTLETILSILDACGDNHLSVKLNCQAGINYDTPLTLAAKHDAGAITVLLNAIKILPMKEQIALFSKKSLYQHNNTDDAGHALIIAAIKQPEALKPLCDHLATFDWKYQKMLLTMKNVQGRTMSDLLNIHHPEAKETIATFINIANAMMQLEQIVASICHPPRSKYAWFAKEMRESNLLEQSVQEAKNINNDIIRSLFLLCINAVIDKSNIKRETRMLLHLAAMINQPEFRDLRKIMNNEWENKNNIRPGDLLDFITTEHKTEATSAPIDRKNKKKS